MSKRIQVLGIELDNHTVRELMFLLDEYVNSDGLNIAGIVTAEYLMQASEDEKLRGLLDMMDLRIIGEQVILEVVEGSYEQQAGEVQKQELEEELLNSLIRRKKTVYWISDQETDLPILNDYMREHYPKLTIAGHFTDELTEENIDAFLNELNSVAPDVILFQTSSPAKLRLLLDRKNLLNAKLCICMSYRARSKYWSPNRNSKIKTLLDQTMFKRKAIRYQMNEEQ